MCKNKILKTKNDKYKYKFLLLDKNYYNIEGDNSIFTCLNYFITKVFAILLLIIIINFENYNYHEFNDTDEKDNELNFLKIGERQKLERSLLTHDFFNITYLQNEMHYYGLYHIFKKPKLSLIFMFQDNSHYDFLQIIKQLNIIKSYNFSNYEIILYFPNLKKNEYKMIKNEYKNFIKEKVLNIYNNIVNLNEIYSIIINSIRSIFTIFLNDIKLLNSINIEQISNYTNGKIDNIFKITTSNNSLLYLLKTKYLKDLIDQGIEFSSIPQIIDKFKSNFIYNFNYIHISLCPDNNYTNLVYVSMISILSNKLINTYVCFYLIIPSDFSEKNINFLQSLYDEYEYFNITYIKMDNRYDHSYTDNRITEQAYYRFSLGELLPNLNKIIYFDSDIIVYKDLTNFYNINFNGKMILGQATYGNGNAQKHGGHRINTGVLLLNLYKMRKLKFEQKVIYITKKGKTLRYHDQTLLNDNFGQYLGLFPPEYHTRPWSNYKEMYIFNKRIGKIYDKDYFYFTNKYPSIRHYLGRYKPRYPKINHIEDWWYYARKSKYFNNNNKTFQSAFSFN